MFQAELLCQMRSSLTAAGGASCGGDAEARAENCRLMSPTASDTTPPWLNKEIEASPADLLHQLLPSHAMCRSHTVTRSVSLLDRVLLNIHLPKLNVRPAHLFQNFLHIRVAIEHAIA